jgi:hypothetical protein
MGDDRLNSFDLPIALPLLISLALLIGLGVVGYGVRRQRHLELEMRRHPDFQHPGLGRCNSASTRISSILAGFRLR